MMRVYFQKDGKFYGGCYSRDDARERIVWAWMNGCTNVEWEEIQPHA
jgi:hypothetical protein